MKEVGILQSIHTKFVLIYVLLILVGMQIIGVYFVRKLEDQLVSNFKNSVNERVTLFAYNIGQEFTKERTDKTPIEDNIRDMLKKFVSQDISEIRVIDNKSKVLGTSSEYNQSIVGKRTTENSIKRTLGAGEKIDSVLLDSKGLRVYVLSVPVKSNNSVQGAVYVIATMEGVFLQLKDINKIFATGTFFAVVITAVLGIFLARTITRPISDMRKQTQAMFKGNFSRIVKVYGHDELGQLEMTFNELTKKLQEAQAMTDGERRRLTSVLTHMMDGVIATDRRGRIILVNAAAMTMMDVSHEQLLKTTLIELLGLEEQYTFDSLLEEPYLLLDFSSPTTPYILKASLSVIHKETGFINGLIVVLHDVTEQEKNQRDQRAFVANVSHELRTPLTTMRSYLEALADGAWKDENLAPQFIEVTQTETERMIRLVTDLLQLSKLDGKEETLKTSWVNFIPFFNKIIDRFEFTTDDKIKFARNMPDSSIFIEFDQDKLTQVVDNIISNAIKYSPRGGKVTCEVKEFKEYIEVIISDEGVGIPKTDINKVFERFYRVDKARSRKLGGTGLGLAIAKVVILAHNGEIWLESKENKGTMIHFTLPFGSQEGQWDEL